MLLKDLANTNYVGIDLSTRDIGYFFKKEGFDKCEYGVLQLERFCPANLKQNKQKLIEFVDKIKKFSNGFKVKIGIELSNFGNPQITNWFHYYAGFLTGLIAMKIDNVEFKYFNANEWFKFFIEDYNRSANTDHITNKLDSDLRKKLVFEECVKKTKIKNVSFNLFNANFTDAWAIANYYEECKNTIDAMFENRSVKKAAKEKKVSKSKQIIKLKEKAIKLKNELLKYKNSGRRLSKPQLIKKERLEIELFNIDKQILEIKNESKK